MNDATKKGRYACKKCAANYPSNLALQRHLADRKVHVATATTAAQVPAATPATTQKSTIPAAKRKAKGK